MLSLSVKLDDAKKAEVKQQLLAAMDKYGDSVRFTDVDIFDYLLYHKVIKEYHSKVKIFYADGRVAMYDIVSSLGHLRNIGQQNSEAYRLANRLGVREYEIFYFLEEQARKL